MRVLNEADGFRYILLEEADVDRAARLTADVFTGGLEPITRSLNVTPDKFVEFIKAFGPKFVTEGLSVLAESVETGDIVAAQLNDDMATEAPELDERFGWIEPALALLDELDRRYFQGKRPKPGDYCHFFMVAISPRMLRKGIARGLLDASLKLALEKGYKTLLAEATGTVSQHVLGKAGFRPRVEIPYKSFTFKGQRPFEGVDDHPSAMLMEMRIKS